MSYIERMFDDEAAVLRACARRYIAQSELGQAVDNLSELEQAVDNLSEFMAAALIFEDVLFLRDCPKDR